MTTAKNTGTNTSQSQATHSLPETNLETTEQPTGPSIAEIGRLRENPDRLTPAKVLGLQRLIGNQATRRLIDARSKKPPVAAPAIQRVTALKALEGTPHNLKQETYKEYTEKEIPDPKDTKKTITVLIPGVTKNTRRTLVKSSPTPGEVNEVNVYSESLRNDDGSVSITFSVPDAPQYDSTKKVAANRQEALQKASQYNAEVGKKIDQYATTNNLTTRYSKFNDNYKWTRMAADQDKNSTPTIDPFFYDILIPYQGPGGENFVLDLLYQHAPSFTGYVEAIYDSGNSTISGMVSMYDKNENKLTVSTDVNVRNPKFTNVHDNDSKSRSAPNIMSLTSGGGEKNLDAYTKIAGEGARWEAVRNHAAKLQDNSYFFTQDPSDPQMVRGVDFRTLWLSWESVFSKKYGITDSVFKTKLVNGLFTYNSAPSYKSLAVKNLTGFDYDLDQSASFKEPFQCITANAGKILNDTTFYIPKPNARNRIWGVQLEDLYWSWKTVFGGAYNIANATIINAIKNDTVVNKNGAKARQEYGTNQVRRQDCLLS